MWGLGPSGRGLDMASSAPVQEVSALWAQGNAGRGPWAAGLTQREVVRLGKRSFLMETLGVSSSPPRGTGACAPDDYQGARRSLAVCSQQYPETPVDTPGSPQTLASGPRPRGSLQEVRVKPRAR